MIFFPNAKINLGLNVLRRRQDGYHDLETVFYPINLCDMLEVALSDDDELISLQLSGIELKDDKKNNLCYRVAKIISEKYNLPKIKIFLHKSIPFGAGLGGGSSDCATTVLAINQRCQLGMNNRQMREIVAKLGADCAFFIENTPSLARGIGDEMTTINLSLKGKKIILIKPNIFVSTKMAYANIVPKIPEIPLLDIIQGPIYEWKEKLKNDFEPTIFRQFPEIEMIKNLLYNNGAIYSAMSGSGSSVFGIFEDEFDLENIDFISNLRDCFLWKGIL